MKLKIDNAVILGGDFKFHRGHVSVQDKIITGVVYEDSIGDDFDEQIDAGGMYLIPGLVDIHLHGAAGFDFCTANDSQLAAIARYERDNGITTICPTTMTLPRPELKEICKKISCHAADEGEAHIAGIHLEGPFISDKKCGAQNSSYLLNPDVDFVNELFEISDNNIRIISMAPELTGGINFIRRVSEKCVVSIAHSKADYEIAMQAFTAGAKHVTHLYNAMDMFASRSPGIVGAAFDASADVELICDGVHVDESVVRITFKMFGADRVVLMSDSMEACGMPDGQYSLGGLSVIKSKGRAALADGVIAGSVCNLYDCMKKAIAFGIAPEIAIKAATFNPARSIGIQDMCGSIEVGKRADLLLLNERFELIRVL